MYNLSITLFYIATGISLCLIFALTVIHFTLSNRSEKDLKELEQIENREVKRRNTKLDKRKRHWFLRYNKQL